MSPVQFWVSAPFFCGSGSVVEHRLAKARVAGSNPVFRSIFCGDIAKWQGRGLQILYPRFKSGCRLHFFLCSRSGGTGRRKGLKIPRSFMIVPVQVRSPAPINIGIEKVLKTAFIDGLFVRWCHFGALFYF